MEGEWRFLLDENVERAVADELRSDGHRADLVVDVLGPGTDDPELLRYAVAADAVVITKDVSDFDDLAYGDHEGILLVYRHGYSASETVAGISSVVDAYGSRNDLRHKVVLDDWIDR